MCEIPGMVLRLRCEFVKYPVWFFDVKFAKSGRGCEPKFRCANQMQFVLFETSVPPWTQGRQWRVASELQLAQCDCENGSFESDCEVDPDVQLRGRGRGRLKRADAQVQFSRIARVERSAMCRTCTCRLPSSRCQPLPMGRSDALNTRCVVVKACRQWSWHVVSSFGARWSSQWPWGGQPRE